ncbi:MAG: hypothetical protein ACI4LK_00380 [Lentihominibacter sp.]
MDFAESNPGSMDVMGDSGLRDEYNRLYMAVINRNCDYVSEQKLPTVHEFLDTYRVVYENVVKPNGRELTDRAYEELFNVENRTDDIMEAQLIIEREHLILNTVTADYKAVAEDFLEAADPNYEVTSAAVKVSVGAYAGATCTEEITYMGEVAKASCDDLAVQLKLKVEMMTTFMSLMFSWAHAKRLLREGTGDPASTVKAMAVTRKQTRQYYRFLSEDMGITFDDIENTPFYRISLLNPQGLDELWRIKKVMHPDNIRAIRYMLFEEILSDRSMEEILLTPQPYPYYEPVDFAAHPEIDEEYMALAEELNSGIRYFMRNRRPGVRKDPSELIDNTGKLSKTLAASAGAAPGAPGMPGKSGGVKRAVSAVSGAATAKSMGKSILKSLFRR